MLSVLGIIDPREKQSSENPSSRGHKQSALLILEAILLPAPPTSLSRHLCIQIFTDLVMILSPAPDPSSVPVPKPHKALAPPWSGRWAGQQVSP